MNLPYQNTVLKDLPNEIWESTFGFDGLYEVSSEGRVKSLRRQIWQKNGNHYWLKERILKQSKYKTKSINRQNQVYLSVQLRSDNKTYSRSVGGLILNSFVGPAPAGFITHHKNFNGEDNRLENLMYINASEKQKLEFEANVRSIDRAKELYEKRMINEAGEIISSKESLENSKLFGVEFDNKKFAQAIIVKSSCLFKLEDISFSTDLSVSQISKVINLESQPTVSTILKLCKWLEIPMWKFIKK